MLILIIVILIICILFCFSNGKKVTHSEIFTNIDPDCDKYSKKECSMPGKISSKCTMTDALNGKCTGPTKIGPKCYDHYYNVCISH